MRPIDADELKKHADLIVSKYKDEDFYKSLLSAYITMLLESCSTIEAEPVRHGHWVSDATGDCCYRCSECQFLRDAYSLDTGNYCPNCGAKMDEEDNT